jgi:Dipeptidyl aminopeptidases/acylaminoacyl-peptidases
MHTNSNLARIWASYPTIWTPQVSGDGKWLAWAWAGITETANIWIVPTDGSASPRMVTDGADHFRVAHINRDGSRLILRQSQGSDEHEQLFILDVSDGATPEPLTPQQTDHYVFGASLHPKENALLFNANCDEAGQATEGSWLHVLDLKTGARRVLARMMAVNENAPAIGMGGTRVLYHRNDDHPRGRQICAVNWDGSDDRCLYDPGPHLKASGSWIGAEGDLLIVAETATHDRLGLLSRDGVLRWLIDDPARHIEEAFACVDTRKVMVIAYEDGRLSPFILDIATGAETRFGMADHSTLPLDQLENSDRIAQTYMASGPDRLVRTDATGRVLNELAVCDDPNQPRTFATAQSVNWTSSDGEAVQGWLYQPGGTSCGLVVWVHGGPTAMSQDRVHSAIQYLVASGFTVLDPNYRGSTGFGLRFRNLIRADGWGGREQDDIRSGIEMLIAQGLAQPGRIGVAGQSYGGYSAWFAITRQRDLVDAACTICGMSDLFVDYANTAMPHLRDYSVEMLGGTPDEVPEAYARGTLRDEFPHITGRLMIVHGLRDTNVSPENSRVASSDLMRLGIGHHLLTFADEGHGVTKTSNRAVLFANMGAFFDGAFVKAE